MNDPKLTLLRGALGGIVREYPIETIIEVLADALNNEVVRRIEPPSEPTFEECKELAKKDKFSYRLYNSLIGG